MIALVGYQVALLLRTQRWLPPLVLYLLITAIGVQGGEPVLDSLGYAATAILPVSAWLVRACVTGEPPAARAITAAATGPARSHLACVLTGFLATTVLGFTGTVVVTAVSARSSNDHGVAVAPGQALTAGLVTTLVCALLGTAVGVLGNRPVLRKPGWSLPVTGLGVLFVLVASGSPANAAVSGLSAGSARGVVEMPWLPLTVAAVGAVVATALACRLARRH